MRPRIHVKLVTEHMKYLEKELLVMEPLIEVIKTAIEKSRTWIEDKNDTPSLTYIQIHEGLASTTIAILDVASKIINDNKEQADVQEEIPSLTQSTLLTTATEKRYHSESTQPVNRRAQRTAEIINRLDLIETSLSSLQDTKHETKDDVKEIKKLRERFETEQKETELKFEKLSKKQKKDFKNIRKQLSEQDNKIKQLNKEKENQSNKTLEKLCLDLKEFEKNIQGINKEIQDCSDKTDSMLLELESHSELIAALQEDFTIFSDNTENRFKKLQLKHGTMYSLLQQRLMPIEKLIRLFNENVDSRKGTLIQLENIRSEFSELSDGFKTILNRVCNRYACHIQLDYNTLVSNGSTISTFHEVREYNGQHFDQTTGKFVSPHDGLYLVCVSLHEWGDAQIQVAVYSGDRCYKVLEVNCAESSTAGSVIVEVQEGQNLYFNVHHADQDAKLSGHSSFSIVSL